MGEIMDLSEPMMSEDFLRQEPLKLRSDNGIEYDAKITSEDVAECDYEFLYELLEERIKYKWLNISHMKMPTWEQHIDFLHSNPYLEHLVYFSHFDEGTTRIAMAYFTKQKEMTIYVKECYRNRTYGGRIFDMFLAYLDKHYQRPFFVNTNPNNIVGKAFIRRRGFDLLQYTYKVV